MHHDVDLLGGESKEVVQLDDLQRLVHQRRRSDGHPGAHVPVGVGEGFLGGGAANLVQGARPEGAAAGGQVNPPHPVEPLAAQALEHGGVLGIHGDDLGSVTLRELEQQLARDHHRFLVRQAEGLAALQHRRRGPQARRADDAVDRHVEVCPGDHLQEPGLAGEDLDSLADRPLELCGCRGIRHADHRGAVLTDLLEDRLPGAGGREAGHLQGGVLGRRPHQIEGLGADGAGAAEDEEALGQRGALGSGSSEVGGGDAQWAGALPGRDDTQTATPNAAAGPAAEVESSPIQREEPI